MPQVGINLNELVYYVKGRPWVNVANSIAEFFSGSSTVYSTNADGYPTGIVNPNDLSARLDLGEGYPNGTYNVDWVGPANAVTVDGGTNGPTSCTFTKATSVLIQLFRIKADITDLRIWHSSENINETFNPVFLDKMKDYAGVRCMNWASPNHDWTPDWNTRRTRTSWSQGRKSVGGGEVAWEFQCELANKIRKPLWLCIHWRASLSYARKLAALIHKELDPDIPVIFEHGNELWNAAFPQFAYSIAPGTGNMADTDQYRRGFVWHAKRTADIGAVFKSVMKGRQVTVALGAQAAGYGFWDYCRSGDPTGDLAAALPNIDAFAIAPYFGNYCMSTDGLRDAVLAGGVDVIFSQIRTHLDMTDNSGPYTQMTEWKNRANTEGKILLGYEGGQHVSLRGVDQGNATLIAHMASANRDSRMYNLYLEYLDQWKTRTGNSLMFLFNDVQDDGSHGAWGHERYEGEAQFRTGGTVGTNHKYKAVWDWINGTTLAGAPTDTMFRAVAALPAVPEPNTIYAIKATTDSDCQIVMTDRAGMPVPLNTGNVYVDVFETPGTGTWTKRAGAVMVKAIAIGGGNGGGSGRRGAAGSDRYGGGGGGGGGIAIAEFPASNLGATEFVWVGAGGAGGAAVTSNDTNGNPGITGYPSAFGCTDNTLSGSTATGTKLKTGAGVPAGGGTNAAGAAGTGGAGFPGLALIGNGSSGGAGSNGVGAAATASGLACPGGGGGGGISTGNTASAGGAGGGTGLASGSGPIAFYVGGAGGAVGVAGEDGANASTPVPGSGGGGGGASTSAAGGDGGAGGLYGAGGGGGGASENGYASGKGGDGANGVVVVVTHGGKKYENETNAFLAASGITNQTTIDALDALVVAWKALGQWDRTVAIYPFVGGNAASHKLNLKDPRDLDAANRLSFAGTLTHSANGVDPDGSTGLANTFIDFNLQVPQYSLTCGYYSRDNTPPDASDYLLFGQQNFWFDIYNVNRINLNFPQTNYATGATVTVTANGVTNFNKLIGFSQNGPSSTSIYQAKNRLVHDTTEIRTYWPNGSPASNRHLRLFGSFGAPGWAGKTNRECAFFFVSYGVDQTTWNALSDIIDAFQTALGRAV